MQRLRIFHETEYRYANPVVLGGHRILVRPRDGHDIRIEQSRLAFTPAALVSWHRDELDNSVALATFDETPTDHLIITSEVVVAHYLSERLDLPLLDHVRTFPFSYSELEQRALSAYFKHQDHQSQFMDWTSSLQASETDTMNLIQNISQAIFDQHTYMVRDEEGVQTPDETLAKGTGSCRDYAWLFVEAARQMGIAARFVSGYFHTAGTALADGATHAWAELYLPGSGWTGFDPTCNRLAAENHIPVAVALMPEDISPVSGIFVGPAGEIPSMTVRVNVNHC